MNIKDIFNKLFKKNTNNSTNIINLNEVIKLPNRSDISSKELILLINNYKQEYLNILATKKYLLPDMLSSKHIQDDLKMNMDLIMNLYLSNEKLPNNKINIITRYLKLKLYLDKINELGNEVLTRLIALTEISKEKVFLSKQKKHRISYEINNLLSIMIMFNSQKYALERECESYFNKLLSLNTDTNLTEEEQKIINKKLKDVYKLVSTIFEIKTDNYQGLTGLVALERQLEIYVYEHKEEANELKWMVEHPTLIIPSIDTIDNLISYELKYRLFNEYGRNLITDEDLLKLYRLKFNILKKEFYNNDYNINLIKEETTNKELECYKIIIMEVIQSIVNDSNMEIRRVFLNNTSNAIKYMIKVLKDGNKQFNSDKIISDKFLLSLLLIFNNPDYLNNFFKTYKISPKFTIKSTYAMQDLQCITGLHESLFNWEDNLTLDTIFKIDNINERLAKVKDSVDYIMNYLNFDRIVYLKKLYLLTHEPEYDFVKRFSEYDPFIGEYYMCKDFYLPEGLKSISTKYGPDSDSLFLKTLMENVESSTVYFPNSLLEVHDDIFIGNKVRYIKLNQGLQYLDLAIFKKQDITKISIPSTVNTINGSLPKQIDTIEFQNFKESNILFNVYTLYKLLHGNFCTVPYYNKNNKVVDYNTSTSIKAIILKDDNEIYNIDCIKILEILEQHYFSHLTFNEKSVFDMNQLIAIFISSLYEEIEKVTGYDYKLNYNMSKVLSKD